MENSFLQKILISFDFSNVTKDKVSGLAKLNICIDLDNKDPNVFPFELLVSFNENQKIIKTINEYSNSRITIPIIFHSHILPNGVNIFNVSILGGNGIIVINTDIEFTVMNEGLISQKILHSLKSNNCPLFIDQHCDSSLYDYDDESLKPWFDKPDAIKILDEKISDGEISPLEYFNLRKFVTDGYLVLDGIIDDDLLDKVNGEIDSAVQQGYQGYIEGTSQRLTHLHKCYPNIGKLFHDRRYLNVVDSIFNSPALPCQSLTYVYGSQQDAHQDTIHLTPFPAGYMCGVWISLEDVKADSGELEVYPGSHRLPRIYMSDVSCPKVKDDWTQFGVKVVSKWQSELKNDCFNKITYRPRRGTVLIWHENLMHAGSIRRNLDLTRRSIVFHCFANGAIAYYDSSGDVGYVNDLP